METQETNAVPLRQLAEKLASIKLIIEEKKTALESLQKTFTELSSQFVRSMQSLDMTSVKMCDFNFYIHETISVKTPKTQEARSAFFEFLKSEGIFEDIISINSNTLNSLYKSYAEKALTENNVLEYIMPGIEPPSTFTSLRMKSINGKEE